MRKPIMLDTETTGFGDDAEVIQLGIIDIDGHVLIDTLIQCQGEVPEDAFAIHGISKDMLLDAPRWDEIHDKLSVLLSSSEYVVIYNGRYDHRLMRQTAQRYGLELPKYKAQCAMVEYANLHFDGDYVKLVEAAQFEGVDTSNIKAHSAIGDCEMTRQVWLSILTEKDKRAKRKAKQEELLQSKLKLVPDDVNNGQYPDYGQGFRPSGYKTLSQLRKRDIKHYEFAGTCCSSFGDRGYLFKPKTAE